MARPHLFDHYVALHAAAAAGLTDRAFPWPKQYRAARPS
jgi:hypothetical protein